MNNKIFKNIILVIILFLLLLGCRNKKVSSLNPLEKKIYESILIAKPKIPNFEESSIQNVYNLIEDGEYYVYIEIDNKWYILAIDDYDFSKEENYNKNVPDGLILSLKGKKGDIALAPDLMVDMVKIGISKHQAVNDNMVINLNEALGLKMPLI